MPSNSRSQVADNYYYSIEKFVFSSRIQVFSIGNQAFRLTPGISTRIQVFRSINEVFFHWNLVSAKISFSIQVFRLKLGLSTDIPSFYRESKFFDRKPWLLFDKLVFRSKNLDSRISWHLSCHKCLTCYVCKGYWSWDK